ALAQKAGEGRVDGGALGRAAAIDAHGFQASGGARDPLRDQARLAAPLIADDGHELRRLIAHGALQHAVERPQFLDAADEFCGLTEHRERTTRPWPRHEAGESTTGFAARVVALLPSCARVLWR